MRSDDDLEEYDEIEGDAEVDDDGDEEEEEEDDDDDEEQPHEEEAEEEGSSGLNGDVDRCERFEDSTSAVGSSIEGRDSPRRGRRGGGERTSPSLCSPYSKGQLFVGSLSLCTKRETFSNHFEKYGKVVNAVIMMDKRKRYSRGFGFVTFMDPCVIEAVLRDEHIIDGKKVEVRRTFPKDCPSFYKEIESESRQIFVLGLPSSLSKDELRDYFSIYGKVVNHEIMIDHSTGQPQGFGFITFEKEETVDVIIAERRIHELAGKWVNVLRRIPKDSPNLISEVSSSARIIFVSGLPDSLSEVEFKEYFAFFGKVVDCQLMIDPSTGQSQSGFGFVTFDKKETVDKIMAEGRTHKLAGKQVNVKRAISKGMDTPSLPSKTKPKARRIFVGGLSDVSEDEFREYFASYGKVLAHRILIDGSTGQSRGYGFITFEKQETVDEIMAEGRTYELAGRQLNVWRKIPKDILNLSSEVNSEARKILVVGLPDSLSEAEFTEHFAVYGKVVDHRIMIDRSTGRSRGFGLITFEKEEIVDKIMAEGRTHEFAGKQVHIRKSNPKNSSTLSSEIFVGGLPHSLSEAEFRDYFASYGKVVKYRIMTDKTTGKSRGFGFLTFEKEETVDEIMAEGKTHEILGKQVELKRAEPKTDAGDSKSGGAGHGSFGGGAYGAQSQVNQVFGKAHEAAPKTAAGDLTALSAGYGVQGHVDLLFRNAHGAVSKAVAGDLTALTAGYDPLDGVAYRSHTADLKSGGAGFGSLGGSAYGIRSHVDAHGAVPKTTAGVLTAVSAGYGCRDGVAYRSRTGDSKSGGTGSGSLDGGGYGARSHVDQVFGSAHGAAPKTAAGDLTAVSAGYGCHDGVAYRSRTGDSKSGGAGSGSLGGGGYGARSHVDQVFGGAHGAAPKTTAGDLTAVSAGYGCHDGLAYRSRTGDLKSGGAGYGSLGGGGYGARSHVDQVFGSYHGAAPKTTAGDLAAVTAGYGHLDGVAYRSDGAGGLGYGSIHGYERGDDSLHRGYGYASGYGYANGFVPPTGRSHMGDYGVGNGHGAFYGMSQLGDRYGARYHPYGR